MNDKAFSHGMKLIKSRFPNFDASIGKNERVGWYEVIRELLDDLNDDQFIYACKEFCNKIKELYPNTNIVAHIREIAEKYYETAEEAWEMLTEFVWKSRKMKLSKRTLAAYRLIGGRNKIYGIQIQSIPFVRNDFIAAYDSLTLGKIEKLSVNKLGEGSRPSLEIRGGMGSLNDSIKKVVGGYL